jgi:hypothetical protein
MLKKSHQDDSDLVLRERLRQASLSFNLAFVMTTATAMIGLAGIWFFLTGKIQAGAVATSGGVTISACYFKLAKDANDRLDKIRVEIDEELH